MAGFVQLLRENRNYRYTWIGQVVSEVGDHFNNIAVFSLALKLTGSGLVVTGVMLSRALPAIVAGPIAGVILDRVDRRRIMIVSDLVRAVVALGFMYAAGHSDTLAAVPAQRRTDVRLAIFHEWPRGHPADHREQGRAAHRQFSDAGHAVDDHRGRRVPRRDQRDAVRL